MRLAWPCFRPHLCLRCWTARDNKLENAIRRRGPVQRQRSVCQRMKPWFVSGSDKQASSQRAFRLDRSSTLLVSSRLGPIWGESLQTTLSWRGSGPQNMQSIGCRIPSWRLRIPMCSIASEPTPKAVAGRHVQACLCQGGARLLCIVAGMHMSLKASIPKDIFDSRQSLDVASRPCSCWNLAGKTTFHHQLAPSTLSCSGTLR